jgi:quercetin dioxygenase-like cupin family protein
MDCPICLTRRGFVSRAIATVIGAGITAQLLRAERVQAQAVAGLASDQLGKGSLDFSDFIGGPSDLLTLKLTFQPGTVIPWHIHPGPVWGIVNSGTLTAHYDESGCKADFPAGGALYVPRGTIHEEHNDGADLLEVISTFILPAGSAVRLPANAPSRVVCDQPLAGRDKSG